MRLSTQTLKITMTTALMFTLSCGEKDDDTDDAAGTGTSTPGALAVSQLDDLPNVIDPVLTLADDTDMETFDSPTGSLDISIELTSSSTGVSLGEDTGSNFYDSVSNASFGSCEMVNRLRGVLQEAASADFTLCEFRTFFGTDDIPETLMDGQDHIVEITEGGEAIERYKINITKTNDKITDFTFRRCEDGSLSNYVRKSVDTSNNVTIFSKRRGSDNNGPQNISYSSQTEVTGTIDTNGDFVGLKTMLQTYSNDFNSDGSDVSYNQYKLIQSSQKMALNGYATQTTKSNDDLLLAFFELGDDNEEGLVYDLSKLSVGAGAITYNTGGGVVVEGWDTGGSQDSSSQWITKVDGEDSQFATPPASNSDKIDLSYSDAEDWDCTGDADLVIAEEDLNISEDDETCSSLELPQGQDMHLECHEYQ